LICDEFFHLFNAPSLEKRFTTALTTLRSFGISLSLVMHNFSGQVPNSLRESILNNCDYMVLFRTHARNAQFFGDFLPDIDPQIAAARLRTGDMPSKHEVRDELLSELQQMPNRQCYFYDKQKTYKALRVRVPDVPSAHGSIGISEVSLDEFMSRNLIYLGGYALPKTVLRHQAETRKNRLLALVRPSPVPINRIIERGNVSIEMNCGPTENAFVRKRKKPKIG
jgi:hypothetical protein